MPGDNARLSVELITPIAMDDGVRFAIREGGRTVGSGVVTKILRRRVVSSWIRMRSPKAVPVIRSLESKCIQRGVAQLAERWSPKPEVASSIPAAPAISMIGDRRPCGAAASRIDRRDVFDGEVQTEVTGMAMQPVAAEPADELRADEAWQCSAGRSWNAVPTDGTERVMTDDSAERRTMAKEKEDVARAGSGETCSSSGCTSGAKGGLPGR